MHARSTRRSRRTRSVGVIASVAALTTLAACSSSTTATTSSSSAGSAAASSATASSSAPASSATGDVRPMVVWVDAPRVPAMDAFKAKYPDIPVDVVSIGDLPGSTNLQQKFTLFNQSGEGWPDAIFFPSNDDIAWATSDTMNYARDLTNELPADFKDSFGPAIAPCIIGEKWRCVRNDVAPDVLWYNAKLFKEWGYTPPTTWEEYTDLSLKIAKEHPGYYTSVLGDAYAVDRYYWPSGCPTNETIAPMKVRIAPTDPKCTRVNEMLDKLIAAGVASPAGIFDTEVAANVGPKLVMTPGATWYGKYLFRDSFKIPAGEMAATMPLSWAAESAQPFTGDEGGGFWGFSSHVDPGPVLDNMITLAQFVAADPTWQVELSTGLPAYEPLQQPWLDKAAADGDFANFKEEGIPAFLEAAKRIRPGRDYLLYNTGGVWTQSITPALTGGSSVSDAWGPFADQLTNEAKTFGYEVDSTPSS